MFFPLPPPCPEDKSVTPDQNDIKQSFELFLRRMTPFMAVLAWAMALLGAWAFAAWLPPLPSKNGRSIFANIFWGAIAGYIAGLTLAVALRGFGNLGKACRTGVSKSKEKC